MIYQSFSHESLRRILDYENRKGIYLEREYFNEVYSITEQIKTFNVQLRDLQAETEDEYEIAKQGILLERDALKAEKEVLLEEELKKVSSRITRTNFKIKLNKKEVDGIQIYMAAATIENFFVLRQIQYNLRKYYKVKQSSCFLIVSQLTELLRNRVPKLVIKTDIKNFYESIPHKNILQKIGRDNLLDFLSKKILNQIIGQYKKLSESENGIPRGIGASAYLAELYMRDVDNHIRALPNVEFYARYVDDIVLVIIPSSTKDHRNYLKDLIRIIETESGLELNKEKTEEFDLIDNSRNCSMEYLGYVIEFGNGSINLKLTPKKIIRYKRKIDLVLSNYLNFSKVNEKKARKSFVKRLRFLTGNTRLVNNKKDVLVGIYYSNSLLTDKSSLKDLDKYLDSEIKAKINNAVLTQRIVNYRFESGFESKRFSPFKTHELEDIIKIW